MTITTYEGVVEKGKIRLKIGVRLPDNTNVYVVVPEMQTKKTARVMSPRLVHRKQVADFKMEISEEKADT
ncbi:MAG: hypothetical protein Q7U34_08650 [Anaerolineales bacterium]|nr:hypothetical protein [Anaerolineales bacterium]